jgi:hypothetical protein
MKLNEIYNNLKERDQGQFDGVIPEGAGSFGIIAQAIARYSISCARMLP